MALTHDLRRLARLYADTSTFAVFKSLNQSFSDWEVVCPTCKSPATASDYTGYPVVCCRACGGVFVVTRIPRTAGSLRKSDSDRVRLAWIKRMVPDDFRNYWADAPVDEETTLAFAALRWGRKTFAIANGWHYRGHDEEDLEHDDPLRFNLSIPVNSFNIEKPARRYPRHTEVGRRGFVIIDVLCSNGREDFATTYSVA